MVGQDDVATHRFSPLVRNQPARDLPNPPSEIAGPVELVHPSQGDEQRLLSKVVDPLGTNPKRTNVGAQARLVLLNLLKEP